MPKQSDEPQHEHGGAPDEPTVPVPDHATPDLVAGRYRIVRPLGRGGGGAVWLAYDESLGREVTLKRVAGYDEDDTVITERGVREARTIASLRHESVVGVYDVFEHEGSPWIVLEYVPGTSLAELLTHGPLPVQQVARLGAQVAAALAAAHAAGIVHRDVKPGNVLITEDGRAKLTDFGIARAEHDHELTTEGLVSGTAAYFSPELARGENPSRSSDVWALGVTLYQAVEGRKPFPERPNPAGQLHAIASAVPDPPTQAGALAPVLDGLLAADATRRWDADHAARVLHEVSDTPASATTAPVGAGDPTEAVAVTTRQVPRPQTAPDSPSPAAGAAAAPPTGPSPVRSRRRGPGPGTLGTAVAVLAILAAVALGVWWLQSQNDGTDSSQTGGDAASADAGAALTQPEVQATLEEYYGTAAKDPDAAWELLLPGAQEDRDAFDERWDQVQTAPWTWSGQEAGLAAPVATVTYNYADGSTVQRTERLQLERDEDGAVRIAGLEVTDE